MVNKKFRIALIDPQKKYRSTYFPTGLCYLSSYLKQNINEKINIRIFNVTIDSLNNLLKFNPNLIGFTSFTHNYNLACQIAEIIKNVNPNIKLIIGGQHISMASWSMPKVFNFGVLGEGEESFLKLINSMIEERTDLDNLTGVQYWQENTIVKCM